jgi:hypothetical protein
MKGSVVLNNPAVVEFIKDAFVHLKFAGFTAEAVPLLGEAGLTG